MEFKFVNNVFTDSFPKLRVFDLITSIREFNRRNVVFGINEGQSVIWENVVKETLLHFHYKLVASHPTEEHHRRYHWENAYPPYQRLQVTLSRTSIAFKFRVGDTAYTFLDWIDDFCHNAVKVRGDPENEFKQLMDMHELLREEENIIAEGNIFWEQEDSSSVTGKDSSSPGYQNYILTYDEDIELYCDSDIIPYDKNDSFFGKLMLLCEKIDPFGL